MESRWFGEAVGIRRLGVVWGQRRHRQVERADRGASRRPAHEKWTGWPQEQQQRGWELDRLAMVFAQMEHLSGPGGLEVSTAGRAGAGSVASVGGGVGTGAFLQWVDSGHLGAGYLGARSKCQPTNPWTYERPGSRRVKKCFFPEGDA